MLSCVSGRQKGAGGANVRLAFTTSATGTYTYRNTSSQGKVFGFSYGGKSGRNGCNIRVKVDGNTVGYAVNNNDSLWKSYNTGGIPVPIGSTVSVTSAPWVWGSKNVGSINVSAFYI